MPLRIAFDLDGVLADMGSELVRQAERLFGEATIRDPETAASDVAPSPADRVQIAEKTPAAGTTGDDVGPVSTSELLKMNLTKRQRRRFRRHVETIENFWERLDELEPGTIQRLATLASDRRWEIIFLTKRPRSGGATAQVQSQRWLESKGFLLPSVFVVQQSRGKIAAALGLDIVVDDTPGNCLDVVVDSKTRAILVWRAGQNPPPAVRRLGIGVVKTVGECLDVLTLLDSPEREDPGVANHVKQLLGFEEAALSKDPLPPTSPHPTITY